MNLLRKLFPNRRLRGEDRFRSTHNGSILDSERGNSPVIIMNSEFLVCLADKMATHLGPGVFEDTSLCGFGRMAGNPRAILVHVEG